MTKARISLFWVSLLFAWICGVEQVLANVTCSAQIFQTVKSPNKSWEAIVRENRCIGDYAFETAITSTVTIASIATPSTKSLVFSIDDAGDALQRPIVSWTSPTNLLISVIQSPYIGTQSSSFSGLTISYAYHSVAH